MHLLHDPAELTRLLAANAREAAPPIDDAAAWLANPRNFALAECNDLGLFEAKDDWPGPLHAHVFFASRGRKAIDTASAMIAQAFDYGATEILGETPAKFRNALMFARLLGFRPYGEEDRLAGKVILSRLALNNLQGWKKTA